MTTEKKPVGRPQIIKDGRQVPTYLDQATIDKAKKIGGSVSSGIRIAVSAYEKAK